MTLVTLILRRWHHWGHVLQEPATTVSAAQERDNKTPKKKKKEKTEHQQKEKEEKRRHKKRRKKKTPSPNNHETWFFLKVALLIKFRNVGIKVNVLDWTKLQTTILWIILWKRRILVTFCSWGENDLEGFVSQWTLISPLPGNCVVFFLCICICICFWFCICISRVLYLCKHSYHISPLATVLWVSSFNLDCC